MSDPLNPGGAPAGRDLPSLLDRLSPVRVDPAAKSRRPTYDPAAFVGGRYGFLTVVRAAPSARGTRVVCSCRCGAECVVQLARLVSGGRNAQRSCGCHRTAFGGVRCPERRSREAAMRRVKTRASYAHVEVCDRWRNDPAAFLADMGAKPSPRHTLDRIDVRGPYSPENCRWATPREQNRNTKRTIRVEVDGQLVPGIELAERNGISATAFHSRIARGWPALEAATLPPGSRRAPRKEAA